MEQLFIEFPIPAHRQSFIISQRSHMEEAHLYGHITPQPSEISNWLIHVIREFVWPNFR